MAALGNLTGNSKQSRESVSIAMAHISHAEDNQNTVRGHLPFRNASRKCSTDGKSRVPQLDNK